MDKYDGYTTCLEDFCGTTEHGFNVSFSADYNPITNMVLLCGDWGDPDTGKNREVTTELAYFIAEHENIPALKEALDAGSLIKEVTR